MGRIAAVAAGSGINWGVVEEEGGGGKRGEEEKGQKQKRGSDSRTESLSQWQRQTSKSVCGGFCAGENVGEGLLGALSPSGPSGRSPRRSKKSSLHFCMSYVRSLALSGPHLVPFSSPLPLLNSLLGCSSIPRLLGIVQAVSVASPFTSPLPSPMASFMQSLPVCSATRKQSTAVPFYLQKASQSRVSSGTRSSFSSLCSSARLTPSRKSRPFPSVPPTAYPIGIVSMAVSEQQIPGG